MGKKAVEYATTACALSAGRYPTAMDTLAAAYAEAGNFEQAIQWETKYLEAPALPEKAVRVGKGRLALYQAHEAYRAEK